MRKVLTPTARRALYLGPDLKGTVKARTAKKQEVLCEWLLLLRLGRESLDHGVNHRVDLECSTHQPEQIYETKGSSNVERRQGLVSTWIFAHDVVWSLDTIWGI